VKGVRVGVEVVEVSSNAGFRPGQCPDCLRILALSEVVDKLQAVHWRQITTFDLKQNVVSM